MSRVLVGLAGADETFLSHEGEEEEEEEGGLKEIETGFFYDS